MLSLLERLKNDQIISELHYQFACFIDKKQQPYGYPEPVRDLAVYLAALCAFNVSQGNTALRLDSALAQNPFSLPSDHPFWAEGGEKIGKFSPPQWAELLKAHIAFSHHPDQVAPMLFQNGLLYFYRYWQAENRIAAYLQRAASQPRFAANFACDREILASVFSPDFQLSPRPQAENAEINWQQIAVATAFGQTFSLISGGPGTGKTTTVASLLVALQLKQWAEGKPFLTIALAAPTGKAAARMKESLQNSVRQWDMPKLCRAFQPDSPITELPLPEQASTLHRLLGIRPLQDLPKYHAKNPLPVDLLVVDEASMIDLFVMEKMMNALKPSTRLILLGDKDQLTSVEAGAIMGELGHFIDDGYSAAHYDYLRTLTGVDVGAAKANPPAICDHLCHLRKSYRFKDDSGIKKLSSAINEQNAPESWAILNENRSDLSLFSYPKLMPHGTDVAESLRLICAQATTLYKPYLQGVRELADKVRKGNLSLEAHQKAVAEIFRDFQAVRFLSALRVGLFGVENLNALIAEALRKAGSVKFAHSRENYFGKPILITENNPQNHIFSGDIGLVLPDPNGVARVYFDTENDQHDRHSLSPNRLPQYEVAYVMTVHKSQGSEFDHTLLILPLASTKVLTKELLYTAVTRAKTHFTLFSNKETWEISVATQAERQSGLREQLLAG